MLHSSLDIYVNLTNLLMSETYGDLAYTAFKLYVSFNNIQGNLAVVCNQFFGLFMSFSLTGYALASCFFTALPYRMKCKCVSA